VLILSHNFLLFGRAFLVVAGQMRWNESTGSRQTFLDGAGQGKSDIIADAANLPLRNDRPPATHMLDM
jgi:hypothetical protein